MDLPNIRLDLKHNWTGYVVLSLVLPATVVAISEFFGGSTFVSNFGRPLNYVLFCLLATMAGLIIKYIGNGWIRVWPNSR